MLALHPGDQQVNGLGGAVGPVVHLPAWCAGQLLAAAVPPSCCEAAGVDQGMDGWTEAAGTAVVC